jgi:small neutral amino acid transporter SnatA (MarC family)
MKQLPANLTPAQAKVYEVIQRNRMAWTALLFVLILLAVGFFSFLGAMFFLPSQAVAKGILGGIDLLLGWALKIMLKNLFPSRGASK